MKSILLYSKYKHNYAYMIRSVEAQICTDIRPESQAYQCDMASHRRFIVPLKPQLISLDMVLPDGL